MNQVFFMLFCMFSRATRQKFPLISHLPGNTPTTSLQDYKSRIRRNSWRGGRR